MRMHVVTHACFYMQTLTEVMVANHAHIHSNAAGGQEGGGVAADTGQTRALGGGDLTDTRHIANTCSPLLHTQARVHHYGTPHPSTCLGLPRTQASAALAPPSTSTYLPSSSPLTITLTIITINFSSSSPSPSSISSIIITIIIITDSLFSTPVQDGHHLFAQGDGGHEGGVVCVTTKQHHRLLRLHGLDLQARKGSRLHAAWGREHTHTHTQHHWVGH